MKIEEVRRIGKAMRTAARIKSKLHHGAVMNYARDPIAVKVYGLLFDAGYYVHLESTPWYGFTLTVAIKPKRWRPAPKIFKLNPLLP